MIRQAAAPAGAVHQLESLSRTRAARGFIALGLGLAVAAVVDLGRSGLAAIRWTPPPEPVTLAIVAVGSLAIGFALAQQNRRRSTALGQLEVAALAHDLRAPMSTTVALLEMLGDGAFGELSGEAQQATDRATGAAIRAQALLEDVLRQRAEAGAAADARQPSANLQDVMTRVRQSLAGQIESTRASVSSADLPTVQADAIALERVLTNLVQNAINHAPSGVRPEIEVTTWRDGPTWEIAVRDHGTGIPAHLRERIFEPGVRGFAGGAPKGYGLGLSTVRRLVEEQGGRAWVDPAIDDGACIRFTLPAAA